MRGFLNYEFAEQHYAEFLREVGAGIADGSIRYREDIVDGLEKAPEAFIGMLDGHNFGKVIVRVGGLDVRRKDRREYSAIRSRAATKGVSFRSDRYYLP